MRTAVLAIAVALAGCEGMTLEQHRLDSRGFSPADLDPPLSDREIHAAIWNHVRNALIPEAELDHGMPACPALRLDRGTAVCAACGVAVKEFKLRSRGADHPYAFEETVYFCPKESAYWYHYVGGAEKRDTWLGPQRLRLRKSAEKS